MWSSVCVRETFAEAKKTIIKIINVYKPIRHAVSTTGAFPNISQPLIRFDARWLRPITSNPGFMLFSDFRPPSDVYPDRVFPVQMIRRDAFGEFNVLRRSFLYFLSKRESAPCRLVRGKSRRLRVNSVHCGYVADVGVFMCPERRIQIVPLRVGLNRTRGHPSPGVRYYCLGL